MSEDNNMYKNGKIYRIVCNITGKQYIGSTTQPLSKRLYEHKKSFKNWKEGKANSNFTTSFNVLEGGDFDIILIESYPCNSKEELHARERHFIESLECVNKCVPLRTDKEYYEDNREKLLVKQKEYYELNKDKVIQYQQKYRVENAEKVRLRQKEYREANKEKKALQDKHYRDAHEEEIKNRKKAWYEANKEEIQKKRKQYRETCKEDILQKNKEYYEANKQTILEKMRETIHCDCGATVRKSDIRRHERSLKHQTFLTSQQISGGTC
jgi:hypothetical protein